MRQLRLDEHREVGLGVDRNQGQESPGAQGCANNFPDRGCLVEVAEIYSAHGAPQGSLLANQIERSETESPYPHWGDRRE